MLREYVNIVRWYRSPIGMLETLSAKHGNTFALQIPRQDEPMVIFAEPAAVKEIWNGDPEVLRAGEANIILRSALGRHSLLLLDGAEHLRERRLMLPPFHGDRMKAYATTMREVTQREIDQWPIGKAFAVHGSMQAITLDVIMRTIFGVSEGKELDELRDALVRYTTLGTSKLGTAILLLTPPDYAEKIQDLAAHGLGRLLPWAKIVRAQRDTDRLVRHVIAERRRENTAGRTDVLSMLLEARDEQGNPMTDDELRDEMLTLLLAGHETTATTLAWVLHHLLANPSWLARVQAEAREVGAENIDKQLDKLVLIDATIKETLRMTPIVPMVARRLAKPVTIAGRDLPAGAVAAASIYLVHHRGDLWPEPNKFDPGRFVGKKADPTHYFPFGGGTRRCLGMAFASYEMKIVLATILANVDLTRASGPPSRLVRRGITLAPSDGMRLVVQRRV
jgi:cytochrome P450